MRARSREPGNEGKVIAPRQPSHAPAPNQLWSGDITYWVFRTNVTGDFGIVTEDFGPS